MPLPGTEMYGRGRVDKVTIATDLRGTYLKKILTLEFWAHSQVQALGLH